MRSIIACSCISFALLLSACAGGASHLPAPWEVPGMVVGSTIENGFYGRRRHKVKNYVRENWAQIQTEIGLGGGAVLEKAFDLARVAPEKKVNILSEIKARPDIYQAGSLEENIEMLTVTLMVHTR